MKQDTFNRLLHLLHQLDEAQITYTLAHHRDEALMVMVAVPGERWEIEFLDDGSVEVERFTSTGEIEAEEALHELLATYTDNAQNGQETAEDAAMVIGVR